MPLENPITLEDVTRINDQLRADERRFVENENQWARMKRAERMADWDDSDENGGYEPFIVHLMRKNSLDDEDS